MKKYTISPVAVIAYVVACLLAVDFLVSTVQTVSQVNDYYAAYGMTASFSEMFNYVLQNCLTPLVFAFLSFLGGYVVSLVWKLNPDHVKAELPKVQVSDIVEAGEAAAAAADEAVEEAKEAVADVEEAVEEAEEAVEAAEEKVEEAADEAEEAAEEVAEKAEDSEEAAEEAETEAE